MTMIRNSIKTPDGTVLISRHRHDFVCHDDLNGKTYCIDGGIDYFRFIGDIDDIEDLCVYVTDGIEKIRESLEWGTYGKDGKGPFRYILLKDMETEHIQACLKTQFNMNIDFREAFAMELEYRKEIGDLNE